LDDLGIGFGVVELDKDEESLGGAKAADQLAVEVAQAAQGKSSVY